MERCRPTRSHISGRGSRLRGRAGRGGAGRGGAGRSAEGAQVRRRRALSRPPALREAAPAARGELWQGRGVRSREEMAVTLRPLRGRADHGGGLAASLCPGQPRLGFPLGNSPLRPRCKAGSGVRSPLGGGFCAFPRCSCCSGPG